jgi:hypothetical protein
MKCITNVEGYGGEIQCRQLLFLVERVWGRQDVSCGEHLPNARTS